MPYHSELCRSRSTRPCPVWLVKLALAALLEIRTTEKLWHSGCNSTRTRRQSHRSNFSMWKSRKCGNLLLSPSRESVKRAQLFQQARAERAGNFRISENTNAPLAPRSANGAWTGPSPTTKSATSRSWPGLRSCLLPSTTSL